MIRGMKRRCQNCLHRWSGFGFLWVDARYQTSVNDAARRRLRSDSVECCASNKKVAEVERFQESCFVTGAGRRELGVIRRQAPQHVVKHLTVRLLNGRRKCARLTFIKVDEQVTSRNNGCFDREALTIGEHERIEDDFGLVQWREVSSQH